MHHLRHSPVCESTRIEAAVQEPGVGARRGSGDPSA
jgi:hypothetical protein